MIALIQQGKNFSVNLTEANAKFFLSLDFNGVKVNCVSIKN